VSEMILLAFPEGQEAEAMNMIGWLFIHCNKKPSVHSRGFLEDGTVIYDVRIPDEDDRIMFHLTWSEYICSEVKGEIKP